MKEEMKELLSKRTDWKGWGRQNHCGKSKQRTAWGIEDVGIQGNSWGQQIPK